MNYASKELCTELYDLTNQQWKTEVGQWYISPIESDDLDEFGKFREIPKYDLGYLIRKFPVREDRSYVVLPEFDGHKIKWYPWESEEGFYIDGNSPYFDCPEDAMARMLIELIKNGTVRVDQ